MARSVLLRAWFMTQCRVCGHRPCRLIHCPLEHGVWSALPRLTEVAARLRDDIYLVDVITRATDEQRVSLPALRTLQIPLPNGGVVPLARSRGSKPSRSIPSSGGATEFPLSPCKPICGPANFLKLGSTRSLQLLKRLAQACRKAIRSLLREQSRKVQNLKPQCSR